MRRGATSNKSRCRLTLEVDWLKDEAADDDKKETQYVKKNLWAGKRLRKKRKPETPAGNNN